MLFELRRGNPEFYTKDTSLKSRSSTRETCGVVTLGQLKSFLSFDAAQDRSFD